MVFEVRQITQLSDDKVVLAGGGTPAVRLRRWGGKSRPTTRLKWTPEELNLPTLPKGAEYVVDGPATPDEVWSCVNGLSVWRVSWAGGARWFESEDKAITFVFEDAMTS